MHNQKCPNEMATKIENENLSVQIKTSSGANLRNRLRRAIFSPLLCLLVASFGIFGGVAALFAGIMCAMIHGIIAGDKVFDKTGTFFLIAAIPMILIGSVFLDELNPEK